MHFLGNKQTARTLFHRRQDNPLLLLNSDATEPTTTTTKAPPTPIELHADMRETHA